VGVIDFNYLSGKQYETVIKGLRVASAVQSEPFHFKSTYKMADHGSSVNG